MHMPMHSHLRMSSSLLPFSSQALPVDFAPLKEVAVFLSLSTAGPWLVVSHAELALCAAGWAFVYSEAAGGKPQHRKEAVAVTA